MALIHDVIDSDVRFLIDPVTRMISNQGSAKLILIRGDHNSERFSFEIPRIVEGHDMSLCNVVRIHYINTCAKTRSTSVDVYEPDDLGISKENAQLVHFSWLISQNATVYAGSLAFAIEFQCVVNEKIVYSWHTGINNTITISDGINNTESLVEDYSDILTTWWLRIYANATLPIEIHTMESFAKLDGELTPNTLHLLQDDPTLEEIEQALADIQAAAEEVKRLAAERDYDADIAILNAKVVGINLKIMKLQESSSSTETKLDEITASLTTLTAAVNTIQSELRVLSDRILALENKDTTDSGGSDDNEDTGGGDSGGDDDTGDTGGGGSDSSGGSGGSDDNEDTGDDTHTHEYTVVSNVVKPTCDTIGYTDYVCSCGEGGYSRRDFLTSLGHVYKSTIIKPTCTEKGYTLHTCTREGCTYSYKDAYTDALGHTWSYYQDPSAGETGWSRECTAEGCNKVETDVEYYCTDGQDHSWVKLSTTDATCETPAYQKYACSVCYATKQEAIGAPLGHSWSDAIYDAAGYFEPTCTTDGKACYLCLNCGTEKSEVVPAGHAYETQPVDPDNRDDDVSSDGYVDVCTVCGDRNYDDHT